MRNFVFHFLHLAPGSYDLEKSVKTVLDSNPAYSFGRKYKENKLDDIPGRFEVEKLICTAKRIKTLTSNLP